MLRSASVAVPSTTCEGTTHLRGNWILNEDIIKRNRDIIKSKRPKKNYKSSNSSNTQWSENITDSKRNLKTLLTLNTEPVSTGAPAKLPTEQLTFHIVPAPWQKSLARGFFFSHEGYTTTIYPPGLECNKGERKWKNIGVHDHGDVLWKLCPLPEALWKPGAQRSRCAHSPALHTEGRTGTGLAGLTVCGSSRMHAPKQPWPGAVLTERAKVFQSIAFLSSVLGCCVWRTALPLPLLFACSTVR